MTPLRESYLINENEQNFTSIFNKVETYNQKKLLVGNRLNESRFDAKFDIKFNLQEQNAIKDLFRIMESKYLSSIPMNESDDNRLKTIVAFFKKLQTMIIGSVSQFVKALIEMFAKLGNKIVSFFENVFGFDGYESYKFEDKIEFGGTLPENQQNFLGAVGNFVYTSLNNKDLQNASKELNEGWDSAMDSFTRKIDNYFDSKKDTSWNRSIRYLVTGHRTRPDGTKISIWKSIGLTILGSVIICGVIPLVSAIMFGTSAAHIITMVCKVVWCSKNIFKVLYNRSKMKAAGRKYYDFWTFVQIVLIIGTPLLFKIPGVKETFNEWLMKGVKALGLDDKVRQLYQALGLGQEKVVGTRTHTEIVDIEDPDTARKAILGDGLTANPNSVDQSMRGLFRGMMRSGKSMAEYFQSVTNKLGLTSSDSNALTKFMQKFDKLHITGPDVYNECWGKLENCQTMQIGFDTSVVKRTFTNSSDFIDTLVKKMAEKSINIDKATLWNLMNKEVWLNTDGNRGAIEVLSLDGVIATKKNINIVNEVLKNLLNTDNVAGHGGTVAGVLNAPVQLTQEITTSETITEFMPEILDGILYTPGYSDENPVKNNEGGKDGGGKKPTPTEVPEEISGMILHDVEKNIDYKIDKILTNVKMTAVDDIMPMDDIQNILKIESDTLEKKADEIIRESMMSDYLFFKSLNEDANDKPKFYTVDFILIQQLKDICKNANIIKSLKYEKDVQRDFERIGKNIEEFNHFADRQKEDVKTQIYQNPNFAKHFAFKTSDLIFQNSQLYITTDFYSAIQRVIIYERKQIHQNKNQNLNTTSLNQTIEELNKTAQKVKPVNNEEFYKSANQPKTPNGRNDKVEDSTINKEKNLISYVSQGKFTVTAFISKKFGNKPIAIFCPYYSMVAIAKEIAGERRNIFPFKNLFKFYTVRCADEEKMKDVKRLMSTLFYDSVLKTYEVVKFTGKEHDVFEVKNGQLYPGPNAPKGESEMLGFLTVREFCAVHNHTIEPYQLYLGNMNVNQTIAQYTKPGRKYFQMGGGWSKPSVNGQTAPERDDIDQDNFHPWEDNEHNKEGKITHSESSFSQHENPDVPKGGYNGNDTINNGFAKDRNPQIQTTRKPKKHWLQKLWNWANESEKFNFDNKLNEGAGEQVNQTSHSSLKRKTVKKNDEIILSEMGYRPFFERKIEQLKKRRRVIKNQKTKLAINLQIWLLGILPDIIENEYTAYYSLPYNDLCVQLSWLEGYDENDWNDDELSRDGICSKEDIGYKLNICIQQKYSENMPWDKDNGDVWDTQSTLENPFEEIKSKDYYSRTCKWLIDEYYDMCHYDIEYDGEYDSSKRYRSLLK